MTRAKAERSARHEFGNVALIEERSREIWQWSMLESTCADLGYAARKLRKSPALTITCLLTLALGIGASTAVFSTINTILLHPLPYGDPGRLVLISESLPLEGSNDIGVSAQEYLDYHSQNSVFSETAAFETADFNLTGTGEPRRINAARISASTLPLLGVTPELGPQLYSGGRSLWLRPRRPLISCALAEPIWICPRYCWKDHPSRRNGIYRHRSHAYVLSLPTRCGAFL